jgi:hypothetical protein
MQKEGRDKQVERIAIGGAGWPLRFRRLHWRRGSAAFLFAGAVLALSQEVGQQTNGGTPAQTTVPGRALTTSPQVATTVPQNGRQNFDATNAERRKQIADDSARLLKLATDLKAEVDKTTKDTLSLNVIRKADEIEKLAHGVKEKMKVTTGAN